MTEPRSLYPVVEKYCELLLHPIVINKNNLIEENGCVAKVFNYQSLRLISNIT
jgi:hypothetical protein